MMEMAGQVAVVTGGAFDRSGARATY